MNEYYDGAINYANGLLGVPMTPEEATRCVKYAKSKLDWILRFEGDLDGERRKPYYLGSLIAERCMIARDFGGLGADER